MYLDELFTTLLYVDKPFWDLGYARASILYVDDVGGGKKERKNMPSPTADGMQCGN
jgi:hypothetical protein